MPALHANLALRVQGDVLCNEPGLRAKQKDDEAQEAEACLRKQEGQMHGLMTSDRKSRASVA
jgi:hypothetical protein